MKVVFLKYARQELDDATQFYALEFSGLGRRFREEVKNAVSRIIEYPEAWPLERGDFRKCKLHKFPYVSCSILLIRRRSLSLQLRISTENLNTGLIGK